MLRISLVLIALILFGGCGPTQKEYEDSQQQVAALERQLATLSKEVEALKEELSEKQKELDDVNYSAQKLLAEATGAKNEDEAVRKLTSLIERHPSSSEATKGKALLTAANARIAAAVTDYLDAARSHLNQLAAAMMGVSAACSNGSKLECQNALTRANSRVQMGLNDIGARRVPSCLTAADLAFKATFRSFAVSSREAVAGFRADNTNKISAALAKLIKAETSVASLTAAFKNACH